MQEVNHAFSVLMMKINAVATTVNGFSGRMPMRISRTEVLSHPIILLVIAVTIVSNMVHSMDLIMVVVQAVAVAVAVARPCVQSVH